MLREFKKAFTLAEVLIVIGIIGVVAALTLPNLNHATGDKEKVTKVKKIYSALTEAVDRAQVIYGNVDTWANGLSTGAEKNERFAKRVTEFMKISKDCGFEAGCFSTSPYYNLNSDEITDNFLSFLQTDSVPQYMVSLSDGTSLNFYSGNSPDGHAYYIRADIDGPNKGKNQEGNDIFVFTIGLTENSNTYKYLQLIPGCLLASYDDFDANYDFTAWVIENGNLDYLKCYDELNWETKTSCE